MIQAKFIVNHKEIIPSDSRKLKGISNITLNAGLDQGEGSDFFAEQPSGNITLNTVSKATGEAFELGAAYMVTFTKLEPEEAKEAE